MRCLAALALIATLAPARAQPVAFDAGSRRVVCETPETIRADGEATLTLRFKPDGGYLSIASHGDPDALVSQAVSVALECKAAPVSGRPDEPVRATFRFEADSPQPLQILPQPPVPPSDADFYVFPEVNPVLASGIERLQRSIRYPDDALEAGAEGRVILSFIVEPDGTPSDIRVVRSVWPSLDAAAVAALYRMRFEPGREDNRRVRTRLTLPVSFALR